MNIVLVTSPHIQHLKVLEADFLPQKGLMYTFVPIGLLMLAAVARQKLGITPVIYDTNREILQGAIPFDDTFYKSIALNILGLEPDIVCMMTECDSYHHVLSIASHIKLICPNCIIELGGPHASAVGQQTLSKFSFIDAILVGESETSFPLFIRSCIEKTSLPIPGVLRRIAGGELLHGGPPALVDDLDNLPYPAYDLYKPDTEEEVFLEVGRGCPFHCSFCSTAPYWHRAHRTKSPKRIVSEIRHIESLYGKRRIHFTHDLFTADKQWVKLVCNALVEESLDISWTCSSRTDTVDENLLSQMAKAGCDSIYFGLETGSIRIQREIKKTIPLSHSLEIIGKCQNVGVKPNVGFIIGFPTEDEESIRDTFDAFELAIQSGARPVHIFGFCPFMGSDIYSQIDELMFNGHFLDLPLGTETEKRNHDLIGSNPELFGSFYRPVLSISNSLRCKLYGIDEFSLLVNMALLPCLVLCKSIGGMFELYCSWASWISLINADRLVSPHRSFYGTPIQFLDFLADAISERVSSCHYALDILKVIRINTFLSGGTFVKPDKASITLRDFDMHQVYYSSTALIILGNVLDMVSLRYDVTPYFGDNSVPHDTALGELPTTLLWQEWNGNVRIIQVDSQTKHLVSRLTNIPEIGLKRFCDSVLSDCESPFNRLIELLVCLKRGHKEGLFIISTTEPCSDAPSFFAL